jgi:LmbE family N-acetylglucosaminyl deacetylase
MQVPISPNKPYPENEKLLQDILACENVLFVGAHPDDIEFYCSALVLSLKKQGSSVTFVIATRGGKGRSGKARQRLEQLRTRHQLDAARVLGGEIEVILLDYPDKDLPNHTAEFARDLESLIKRKSFDLVMSWDLDHIYNPHPDHRAAARAAALAVQKTSCKACYYGTKLPNLWLGFDDDVFNIKLKAIRAHRTEVPWFFYPLAKRFLTSKDKAEGAKIGIKYAETYRCPWIE